MLNQPHYWIAVASKEHVLKGVREGFCQVCHGKLEYLKRLHPNDWIVYYSPRTEIKTGDVIQSFTAVGRILEGEPYSFDMGNGFVPHRRKVEFFDALETPIRPMLESLSFIKNKQSWGCYFRFGLLKVTKSDFVNITTAMKFDHCSL